jgi:dihydroorotate dehydrogenase
MWKIMKSLLFLWDAEKVHAVTMRLFSWVLRWRLGRWMFPALGKGPNDLQPVHCMGLEFANPIGLAAGFDKDGKYFSAMSHLGFGFVEIGTVTPEPQAGNEKPRLFRLPKDQALINRLGFNNDGVAACVDRLKNTERPKHLVIGGNIGKNKWTANEEAHKDYEAAFTALFPYVDYFVVNVSSPNTPGLRELQDKAPLDRLLSQLQQLNQKREDPKPILLKIAPDISLSQLDDIVEVVKSNALAGCVVSNTTIRRENLLTDDQKLREIGAGGLSGAPLFKESTLWLSRMREALGPDFVLIGVGGLRTVEQVREKLEAGADLVQIYSGLVYEGPGMVRSILRKL